MFREFIGSSDHKKNLRKTITGPSLHFTSIKKATKDSVIIVTLVIFRRMETLIIEKESLLHQTTPFTLRPLQFYRGKMFVMLDITEVRCKE